MTLNFKNRAIYSYRLALFGVMLLHCIFVSAEDLSRRTPKLPDIIEKGQLKEGIKPEAQKPSENETDATVIMTDFKGLVLWGDSSQLKISGVEPVKGLQTDLKLSHRSDLEKNLEPFWNKSLNVGELHKLTQVIESHFLQKESLWVLVQVEEQKIQNEALQIVILEVNIGNIEITGNRWFETQQLRDQFFLDTHEPLNTEKMEEALKNFNQNPFRQGDLYMAPGETKGSTDLHLKIKDRFPVRFYSGYENTGNDLTGNDRWFSGFNWGDAFMQGHLMSYQFTTDGWLNRFKSHSGSYSIPMPFGGHRFDLMGGYSEAEGSVTDFEIKGKSWIAVGRYRISLPKLNHEVAVGYDFKQSNNNLEFGGSNVFNHLNDVSQFVVEYQGTVPDPWGSTQWGSKLIGSPGKMTENNSKQVYQESRAFSKADYIYAQAELERKFKLPWEMSTRHSALVQWASGNLLGSEQLGVGGRDTVRGYSEHEANGDQGLIMHHELWSPQASLGSLLKSFGIKEGSYYQDSLQSLVFWDYGVVRNRFLLPNEDREKILSSVGCGVRYTVNSYLNFRADTGFQLSDSGQNNPNSHYTHLSLTLSY